MTEAAEPEVLNPEEIKDWIKLAKYHKGLWVKSTDRGDMTPTVFAERDGNVLCAVVAPQVDKFLGLKAAAMLRKALAADVITMIVDAHIYHGKEGQTEEEFLASKPVDMQKACDEEGACERGDISDCLVCHRIAKADKKIITASLPYYYHGKETTFRWLNDENFAESVMSEREEGVRFEGLIPDALRQIIDLPSFLDDPTIQLIATKMKITGHKNRQMYHTARAVYTALAVEHFAVFDYYGHGKPWEQFKEEHGFTED